jgi:hypothetical protein
MYQNIFKQYKFSSGNFLRPFTAEQEKGILVLPLIKYLKLVALLTQDKCFSSVWYLWLLPIILATQETETRRIIVQRQNGQIVHETFLENNHHKIGLVEWFMV